MAAQFCLPISVWLGLCDREPDREQEVMALVERHIYGKEVDSRDHLVQPKDSIPMKKSQKLDQKLAWGSVWHYAALAFMVYPKVPSLGLEV